jgi:5-methylcytosine-specific restriction endonuclease McrBC regulatory subunit McrC
VGRLGETTVPLSWNSPTQRALGHLVPDFVIHRPDSVEIVDAKYKAHFADLDSTRWREFTDEAKESLRADVHQVLAYAAVVGSPSNMKATLLYPVRQDLFEELQMRNHDRVFARIPAGVHEIHLQMRAMPFGRVA